MTASSLEERTEAVRTARKLLADIEHGVEDILIVADWLLTGRCDTALAFAEQTQRWYSTRQRDEALTPDPPTGA